MNIKKLRTYWYPLLESRSLKEKPLPKVLLGESLVLVRLENEVQCFKNQCPHRGVALSNGSIHNNQLQCHYHGWCFNKEGELCAVPGSVSRCSKEVRLSSVSVHEEDGLLWVRLEGTRVFTNLFFKENDFAQRRHAKIIKADFIHSIENFLDPMHTAFIHKNLLRAEGSQRMEVNQELFSEGFCTTYRLLDKQNGLINRLFDAGVTVNVATFYLPGYAHITYEKEKKILFSVAVFFVPLEKGKVQMWVEVSLPKSSLFPAWMRFGVLRPFIEWAFSQDKKILKEQYLCTQGTHFNYLLMETDLVMDHLLHLLLSKEEGKVKEMEIKL